MLDLNLSFITFPFLLDILPVGLACYALLRLNKVKKENSIIYLARASSILLIICQFTWIHSYLNGFPLVTSFIDSLWSLFNGIVMVLILLITEREVNLGNCSNCGNYSNCGNCGNCYMSQTQETLK